MDAELIQGISLQLDRQMKVTIRKAWSGAAAMDIREKGCCRGRSVCPDTAAISEGEANNLHEAFEQRHCFRTPSRRLVDNGLQGQLLLDFTASPTWLKFILIWVICNFKTMELNTPINV